MLKKTIFDESTVGFFLNDQFGAYMGFLGQIIIENGKTYTVIWDGVSYTCTAFEANFEGMAGIAIGNTSFIGMEDTGEPFIIGVSDGSGFAFTPYTQASHSVSIYQETFVILQDRHGVEQEYSVPNEKIKLNTSDGSTQIFSAGEAIENVPISLDFSNGDQTVTADNGYFVKSAIIKKPVDLVAGNVRLGKVIAGIEGDFVGDTEEKIISGDTELTFADGESFLIEPSSAEKVISKVTISPPSALVPENIAKDVTIAGITGTHEGGGSGGGGGDIVAEKYVKFYDYDGTLLYEYTVAEANALSELPALPTHDGLICQGWNYSLDKVKALTSPTNIGAIYITDDGKTRVRVEYTADKANSWNFYWQQSVTNGVVVDWGDGSSPESVSGTGVVKLAHEYATAGDYIITFDVIDGCTFILGSGNDYQQFIGTFKYLVKSIHIGNGDVKISDYAFNDNYLLKSITIPNNVTSIGNSAFYDCYSLTNITIPNNVTSIGDSAFYNCYSLTSIKIPEGVTSIGSYAFYNCRSLTSIEIPEGVTSIGDSAFYQCYTMVKASIPSTVTSIGTYTFYNCGSLTSIKIPSTVTSIGNNAFYGCYSLTSIEIPEGVTSIGNNAFRSCFSLTSIKIPSTVTSIGTYAFEYCGSLTSIEIPEGVTSIGSYTFSNCQALSNVSIPSTVTSIETYAFTYCHSLKNMKIPAGVTSIGNSAFFLNYSLGIVDFSDFTTIPTLGGTNAFYKSNLLTIKVPSALLSSWKTKTNWSNFASYMVGV